jgi:hypothetical protein
MSASDPSEDKNQMSSNGRERNSHVARRCRAKTNLWKNHLELFFFLIRISILFAPDRERWVRFSSSST